jgi:hypothetical protein
MMAWNLEGSLGLEELAAVGINQADVQVMRALVGEIGADAQDEDHGGVTQREVSSPDGVEDAQDVEFAFLADVGGVGDDGEVDFQDRRAPQGRE